MEQFSVQEEIGYDTFGGVYRGVYSNEEVVVKRIFLKEGSKVVPGSIVHKISLLKEMDHPQIARLLEVVNKGNGNHVYQVFEYTGPDLRTFMKKFPDKAREPEIIKNFLHQILSGISYYHSNSHVHGRLTPKHVMIDTTEFKLKLLDVGMNVKPSGKAPEVLLDSTKYSFAADVWAIGCIFAEMVRQKPLYDGPTANQERSNIFRVLGMPTENTSPGVNSFFSCLNSYAVSYPKKIAARLPGLEPAGVDLLLRMLSVDPEDRITVEGSLKHNYFEDFVART